jgi:hypothetical protein
MKPFNDWLSGVVLAGATVIVSLVDDFGKDVPVTSPTLYLQPTKVVTGTNGFYLLRSNRFPRTGSGPLPYKGYLQG